MKGKATAEESIAIRKYINYVKLRVKFIRMNFFSVF